MISFFRRALSSWLVLGLLGILVIAFIVTGIAPNGTLGGSDGGTGENIATVGGTKIHSDLALRQADTMLNIARQQQPALDMASFVKMGGVDQLVGQMITGQALKSFGEKQGLSAAKRLVDAEIAGIQAFQIGGKFDQKTYEGILAQQHLTDRQLREGISGDVIRRQLLVPVTGGISPPKGLVAPYAALLLEERKGVLGTVPAAFFAQSLPAPSEADVRAFYTRNIARFTIPERRVIRYALLDPTKLAAQPSAAEVDAYYKANAANYAAVTAKTLRQVVLKTQAEAQKFVSRTNAGEPFAKLASEAGFTPADTAIGEQSQKQFAAMTSANVAAAAFATPAGKVSNPVQSDFGWHVVRVDAEKTTPGKSLEAARADITTQLAKQKSEDATAALVAKIDDAISGGQGFLDVAKANGLQPVSTPPLVASGQNPADAAFKPDAAVARLLKTAFGFGEGDAPIVEQLPDNGGYALLDVERILAPAPVPFEQVAAVAAAGLRSERAAERAKAVAGEILTKVKRGTPLAAALAEAKLPPPSPIGGRRMDMAQQGQQPSPALPMLFSLANRGAQIMPVPGNQGWLIVQLESVKPGDAAAAPGLVEATQGQFARFFGEELAAQFARAALADVGVKQNQGAIDRLKKRLTGGGAQQ